MVMRSEHGTGPIFSFSLQEVVASPGHAGTAVGVGLALARQTRASASPGALLWVREAAAAAETGDAYGPGLAGFGMSPDGLILVEAGTQVNALRAALDGARCAALSAVVLETKKSIDLTASRRLKLASEKSGVAIVLIRLTDASVPNAAQARWRVAAAPQTVPTGSRSFTAFKVEVLKHPVGLIDTTCIMEWHHEWHSFAEAIPLPLAAVSDVGSLAA